MKIFKKKKKRITYMAVFPNWCPVCKKDNAPQTNLFMQSTYTQNLWIKILNIFEGHLTFPKEVKDLLDMALMYHPFKNAKALLWRNIIMASFWNLWKERNQIVLPRKRHTYTKLFNNVVYHSISWCKLSNILDSYSHTSLFVNWEGLL